MKLYDLFEKYDKDHKCKTPGAIYKAKIHSDNISLKVELPIKLDLNEKESIDLEADLHYAVEKVLAKFFI